MAKTNYPIGDFLIRIKNAVMAGNRSVEVGSTKLIKAVAQVLKKGEYLSELKEKDGRLVVQLSYRKKEPVLMDVKLVSRPGLRVYMSVDELGKKRGPSTFVVSTSKGVLLSKEAIKKGVGGEVIAEVL